MFARHGCCGALDEAIDGIVDEDGAKVGEHARANGMCTSSDLLFDGRLKLGGMDRRTPQLRAVPRPESLLLSRLVIPAPPSMLSRHVCEYICTGKYADKYI